MKSGRDHPPILDVGGGEDEDRVLAEALSDRDEVEMRRRRISQTRLKRKMTGHYYSILHLKHAKWRLTVAERVGKKCLDWTVMMSQLSWTALKSRSDGKNR